MKKRGFTLAEVLICIAIVAVLAVVGIVAYRSVSTSYTAMTYHAYNNLKIAIREMFLVTEDSKLVDEKGKAHGPKDVFIDKCYVDGINGKEGFVITNMLKPDFKGNVSCDEGGMSDWNVENMSEEGLGCEDGAIKCKESSSSDKKWPPYDPNSFNFCKRMASIVNHSGGINCNSALDVNIGSGNSAPYISNLNPDNPSFIAANGQRYYISKRVESNEARVGYRLVAVDVNGTKGPNILSPSNENNKGQIPDIVTFMVLDNGSIYPIGTAGDNLQSGKGSYNYLSARIKGYKYVNKNEVEKTKDGDKNALDLNSMCTSGTNANNKTNSQQECEFAVKSLVSNTNTGAVGPFKTMYCLSGAGANDLYSDYCNNIDILPVCPGGSDPFYDECVVEPIKPMFRLF